MRYKRALHIMHCLENEQERIIIRFKNSRVDTRLLGGHIAIDSIRILRQSWDE